MLTSSLVVGSQIRAPWRPARPRPLLRVLRTDPPAWPWSPWVWRWRAVRRTSTRSTPSPTGGRACRAWWSRSSPTRRWASRSWWPCLWSWTRTPSPREWRKCWPTTTWVIYSTTYTALILLYLQLTLLTPPYKRRVKFMLTKAEFIWSNVMLTKTIKNLQLK